MAPGAMQGTAFQKDSRANAGSVMQGGSLDIKDHTGKCHGIATKSG
jgi:hypothetical protein